MATIMVPTAHHTVPLRTSRTRSSGRVTQMADDVLDSTFVTTEITLDDSIMTTPDDFDPFRIGDASKHNQRRILPPPLKNTTTKNVGSNDNNNNRNAVSSNAQSVPSIKATVASDGDNQSVLSASGSKSTTSRLVPPRMLVKFKIHEEVSSVASLSGEHEGASEVFVEGTVLAQVVSSDALKNAPFVLASNSRSQNMIEFIPNETYTKTYPTIGNGNKNGSKVDVVRIPKDIVGFVNIGKYHFTETVEHMPLLLEQKVVRSKNKIQIAVQVRSKLSNPDDLSDFTIVISIPGRINGNSVAIVSGEGQWDRWKRCITWEMDQLPKGQSFMVSAKCTLDELAGDSVDEANDNTGLKFPVMLRCRSKDQITSTRFQAAEASGHPASVSSSTADKSFRIVHRLK